MLHPRCPSLALLALSLAAVLPAADTAAPPTKAAAPIPYPLIMGPIRLWAGDAPGALGQRPQDIPTLTPYLADKAKDTGATILVLPGGGYGNLAEHEGTGYAEYFAAHGINAYVLKYRLGSNGYRHPTMLNDGARAIRMLRAFAKRDSRDPNRIAVIGSSAGGHLATMLLSCRWKDVDPAMPAQLVTGALSVSGLYDLEPLRHVPSVQADLQLTPAAVRRLSPAFFPRPKRPLYAVVGGDESDEVLRQNLLIRAQWGPTAVPVCETLSGRNHFSVLRGLAEPQGRLHELALRLLGLH